jgi:putative transposase
LTAAWVPHDVRDEIVDFVVEWAAFTELPRRNLLLWFGLARGRFYEWKKRYGKVNEHNGRVPRDHWLMDWERQAICDFASDHPLEGYRRLAFMMLDADVVAVSPSSVYRVLRDAGLLNRWNRSLTKKGTGFVQPLQPHEHWHIDIAYLNIAGSFVFLCTILDGCSRFIVHHELHETMPESRVELVLQRAREKFPQAKPRIISDNGPQFIARDFKSFIRLAGMTHVRTSPYYPQSNGKIERWHQSLKSEAVRVKTPLNLKDAREVVGGYVIYYNKVRLHSAIGYLTPETRLSGRHQGVFDARDAKLAAAREQRRISRLDA